ncbi:MAG: nitroreductase family protein [Flavobacteriales bacterium]|nr:nitroreductase family protein [Flavobacteriales bacterium]HPF89319.1 nitroreductase family protein [Flavobacteriales bacterium]
MSVARARRSDLPVHPVLNERFSPRAFSDRAITDAELELVLEAARWAPSSMNEQPWRFLVTRKGGDGHAELLAALNPSNQVWADKAPVLILNLVHRTLSRNGQENYHARHDLGLATAQLTAQATALGMGLHILGGFNAEMVRTAFEIPDTYDLVSVIALGFPGDPESLPEHLQQRELQHSPRRPLSELVHYGRFNG